MNINEILSKVDHTILKVDTTFDDVKSVCDDAIKYKVASVCIPPSFVKKAKEYVGSKMKICTVVGFPNGYSTTKCKLFETYNALEDGSDEIDMVINIGALKSQDFKFVEDEIKQIKKVCEDKVLKVIIETCLLTEEQKIKMCEIVTSAKADFIKTSTGFSKHGATKEDIVLFKKYLGKDVKIKAAGGISDLKQAEEFINLGADRLGTSKVVKLAKEMLK